MSMINSFRWKGGIVLFLNLVVLALFSIDPFNRFAGFNILTSFALAFFVSTCIVSVFEVGLYRTDEAINKGFFNAKWLFRESISTMLIIAILSMILSGIAYLIAYLNFNKYTPDGSIGLFILSPFLESSILIYSALLVLLLFVMPSLFIYKFRESKYAVRAVFDTFIILFSLLLLGFLLLSQAYLHERRPHISISNQEITKQAQRLATKTANWQTYKTNGPGFDIEFRYPAEWLEAKNLDLKLGTNEFFTAWRDRSGQRKLEFFNICIAHTEPNRSMQFKYGFFNNANKDKDIIIDGRNGILWKRFCYECYDNSPQLEKQDTTTFIATVCNKGDFCLAFSLGTAGIDKEWSDAFQSVIDSVEISPAFDVLPEQKLCPGPGFGFLNGAVIKDIISV